MQISEAESAVMDVLWSAEASLSAEDIARELKGKKWSAGTIATLLSRLLKKGALSGKKDAADGRRFLYRPKIKRERYVASQTSRIAKHFFEGALAPLVSHLSKRGKLSPNDIEALKRVIQEIEDER